MRALAVLLLFGGLGLTGCNQADEAMGSGQKSAGRYSGIGTFSTGRLWKEMARTEAPSDPAAAKLEDDEHVIVVIDSHTGEVRQCGDYSGYCVVMDPWAAQGANSAAPVKLTKHASDLAAEDQAAAQ